MDAGTKSVVGSAPSALGAPDERDAAPAIVLVSAAKSFEDVYSEHVAFVWRSCLRLGVEPALIDDIVQEVFLIVHRRRPEFQWRSSVRTWLFGMVRRVVARARRTALRKPSHLGIEAATDPDTFFTPQMDPLESAFSRARRGSRARAAAPGPPRRSQT